MTGPAAFPGTAFAGRQIGQKNRGQDQRTTTGLDGGEPFVQQHPCTHGGHHRDAERGLERVALRRQAVAAPAGRGDDRRPGRPRHPGGARRERLIRNEEDKDKEIEPDWQLAKFNIDLLGILEEKCKGNLSGDEEKLLKGSLDQLRMLFVELSGRK